VGAAEGDTEEQRWLAGFLRRLVDASDLTMTAGAGRMGVSKSTLGERLSGIEVPDKDVAARPRRRAVGAGARRKLVFVDRLLAALVHLRHGATHDVLACWFGVDPSTVTRAIGEIRPLLARRGAAPTAGWQHA
jgi:Helix-turn-helix of DDE superfamily endonuclease